MFYYRDVRATDERREIARDILAAELTRYERRRELVQMASGPLTVGRAIDNVAADFDGVSADVSFEPPHPMYGRHATFSAPGDIGDEFNHRTAESLLDQVSAAANEHDALIKQSRNP